MWFPPARVFLPLKRPSPPPKLKIRIVFKISLERGLGTCTECNVALSVITMSLVVETNSKKPNRHQLRRLENRQAILEAAEKIMVEQGAAALTPEELARVANVSRRTIFNHFQSALDAVHERMGQHIADLLARYKPSLNPATTGFERTLLHEARKVITLPNIAAHLYPAITIGISLLEANHSQDWKYPMMAAARQHLLEESKRAYPQVRPIRLAVFVNLLIDIIESSVELWLAQYFARQSRGEPEPTMSELFDSMIEGFDYIQQFIAPPSASPESK